MHRDWPTLYEAGGRDGATQIVHHWSRDQAAGWGDGKRVTAAGWGGAAAEEGLWLGWPLEGLVTRSPRVTKAALL